MEKQNIYLYNKLYGRPSKIVFQNSEERVSRVSGCHIWAYIDLICSISSYIFLARVSQFWSFFNPLSPSPRLTGKLSLGRIPQLLPKNR